MQWLQRKIVELQNRSYEEKLKFLKKAVISVGIFLLLLWLLSLRYHRPAKSSESLDKFGEIWQNVKQLKEIQLKPR